MEMGGCHDTTANQGLSYVIKKGVILTPNRKLIKYIPPVGIITSELLEMIRIHKRGTLGILNENRQIRPISPYLSKGGSMFFAS